MRDDLPVDELEALAEEDVGEALRRTRLYYKKSLDEIEVALRIRACQIQAIEDGNMDALPGRVYAIGFVRSYAEYMQLDGAKVVQLFKAQYMDGNSKAALSFPMPASETKTPPIWLAAFCLLVLSAVIYGFNIYYQEDRTLVEVVEDVPDDIKERVSRDIVDLTKSYEEPIEPSVVDNAPVENMGDDDKDEPQTGIVLNILGDSWIEIKADSGKILVSKILTRGDEYFVPNSPGLSMSLGNAANVEIIVNGRALQPLGKDGEVRKGIPLNTAYLQTLQFVEPEKAELNEEEIVEEPETD